MRPDWSQSHDSFTKRSINPVPCRTAATLGGLRARSSRTSMHDDSRRPLAGDESCLGFNRQPTSLPKLCAVAWDRVPRGDSPWRDTSQ